MRRKTNPPVNLEVKLSTAFEARNSSIMIYSSEMSYQMIKKVYDKLVPVTLFSPE